MSPYFDFHPTRCQQFLEDGGIHVSVRKHSELINLAEKVLGESTGDTIRLEMLGNARYANHGNPEGVDTSLAPCAKLLLMVDIGSHQYGVSGSNPLWWLADQSLKQAMWQHFESQRENLEPENTRLGRLFTGRNLGSVGGLKVRWTTNLVDHLLLANDDQTVFVFHCVGFLRFQKR